MRRSTDTDDGSNKVIPRKSGTNKREERSSQLYGQQKQSGENELGNLILRGKSHIKKQMYRIMSSVMVEKKLYFDEINPKITGMKL